MASSIHSIPNELIRRITASVASFSLLDFLNFTQTCKLFRDVGDDDYIFQQVSMDTIPVTLWHPTAEAISFIQRCRESRNPEALFRLGMVHYFSKVQDDLGMALLAKASSLGHEEAAFVLGVILICTRTDTSSRLLGVSLLHEVNMRKISKNKSISECQKRSKTIIRQIWRNKTLGNPVETICKDRFCKEKTSKVVVRGWDGKDNCDFECEACLFDHEVNCFCRMLRGH